MGYDSPEKESSLEFSGRGGSPARRSGTSFHISITIHKNTTRFVVNKGRDGVGWNECMVCINLSNRIARKLLHDGYKLMVNTKTIV